MSDHNQAQEDWQTAQLLFEVDDLEDVVDIVLLFESSGAISSDQANSVIKLFELAFEVSSNQANQFFNSYGSLAKEAYWEGVSGSKRELHSKAIVAFSLLSEKEQALVKSLSDKDLPGLHRVGGVATAYQQLVNNKGKYFSGDENFPLAEAA